MRASSRSPAIVLMLAVLMLAAHGVVAVPASAQQLVVCGWDEVFVLDVTDTPKTMWRWKAAERPELPADYRTKFRTTDDCKPVAGNRLLVTASSDGAALVDRATGATQWWGQCGNTHSADLLPGNRVVLACSVREHTGNRLVVFDAAVSERELFSTPLHSGHGAVWDSQRELLWALGMDELRAYTLRDWTSSTPSLVLNATYPLPDPGGHELAAVPGSSALVVSTHASVWIFDRDTRVFAPHPDLAGRHDVKAVAVHPTSGQLAFVQATPPDWWSSTIGFLHPARTITLEGERMYKVRWLP